MYHPTYPTSRHPCTLHHPTSPRHPPISPRPRQRPLHVHSHLHNIITILLTISLTAALAANTHATLTFASGDEPIVTLANYGSVEKTITLYSDAPPTTLTFSPTTSSLYTVVETKTATVDGDTQYNVTLSMTEGVGKTPLTVTAGADSASTTLIVAGFVLRDPRNGDNIVSGDERRIVSVGQSGVTTLTVDAVDVTGSSLDLSGTIISAREMEGPYMRELDEKRTKISGTTFTLAIAPNRVGTGSFIIEFMTNAITLDGESFETVLQVMQQTKPVPPCVVAGGDVQVDVDGRVSLEMFNLLVPPRNESVETVTLTVGDDSTVWNRAASSLVLPDQTVVFPAPSTIGEASVECDGEAAVISGEAPLRVMRKLAVDAVEELDTVDGSMQLFADLIVKNSSTVLMTADDAMVLVAKFCDVMSMSGCKLTGVRNGSAVCTAGVNMEEKEREKAEKALEDSFENCSFQYSTGYPCDGGEDDLELGRVSVNAIGPDISGAGAGSGGVAVWTVVLVAGLGAVVLFALLLVGLIIVYRRSVDESESDYSSSGPLGVPEPTDVLYEQSIVRDIYGRGEWAGGGGPSREDAEKMERAAELREEVLERPSSAYGLSRSSGTGSSYSI